MQKRKSVPERKKKPDREDVSDLRRKEYARERRNNELIALLRSKFKRIEVVRGGAVAIESISTSCR